MKGFPCNGSVRSTVFLFFIVVIILSTSLSVKAAEVPDIIDRVTQPDPASPDLRAFTLRQDHLPLHGDLESMKEFLLLHSEVTEDFQKKGRIRFIVSKEKKNDQKYMTNFRKQAESLFQDLGLDQRQMRVEFLEVNFQKVLREAGATFRQMLDAPVGEIERYMRVPLSPGQSVHAPLKERLVKIALSLRQRVHRFSSQNLPAIAAGAYSLMESISNHPVKSLVWTPLCKMVCCAKAVGREALYISSVLRRATHDLGNHLTQTPWQTITEMGTLGLLKLPAMIGSVAEILNEYANVDAPFHLGFHIGLSIGLTIFFGPLVSIWIKSNGIIYRERGDRYQMLVNFTNANAWPIIFFINSLSAGLMHGGREELKKTAKFFGALLVGNTFDAPIAARSYRGLNDLVEKGAIPRGGASLLQVLVKDTVFTWQMTALGTGNILLFVKMWCLNQLVGLSFWGISLLSLQRPFIGIVDRDVFETATFNTLYPNAQQDSPIDRTTARKVVDHIMTKILHRVEGSLKKDT